MSIKIALLTRIRSHILAAKTGFGKICKGRGKSNHSVPEKRIKPLETFSSDKLLRNGTLQGFCEYAKES